jgi:hypothetical protein
MSAAPVTIEVVVTLSDDTLEQQFGELVSGMGATLAEAVAVVVAQEKLGYFPALTYFQDRDDFDQSMLASAMHIYHMVCETTRETARAQLRTLLKGIRIDQAQALAETLPRVRPGQVDARHLLARHYSPSAIRLQISGEPRETVSGIPDLDEVADHTRSLLLQRFARVNIASARSHQVLNPHRKTPI